MRIGEIAALVGLTIRAIRHNHHVGLLPEPERRPLAEPPGATGPVSPDHAALLAPAPRTSDLVAVTPDEPFAAISEDEVVVTGLKETLFAEYAPAQAEVVSRLMDACVERGRG
ncbi:MerR family transcriptional regulator [Streptomyces platensis]|uniref:MerR family transcriptional regulator n=1 Tax=Streptomyces platensis TaxID=58346 RepID=UPI001F1E4FE7|nr:MerR family transcriptional regulator [Streptomyces platensis]MCF3142925.1 MerR family transcriptional regulator [Streptomyces platensis]